MDHKLMGDLVNEDWDRTSSKVLMSQFVILTILLLWFISRSLQPRFDMLLGALLLIPIWQISRHTLYRDLIPFLMIFITYESLRGFGDNVRFIDIHIEELIAYEKSLFDGIIPAYYLQTTLMQSAFGNLLDILTTALYMSHYFVPIIAAIMLWHHAKAYYWPFVIGFIIMAYTGFAIYLFYPAAPPWWATRYGFLVDQPVFLPAHIVNLSSLASNISPNKVAAMPSLHMAFPTYVTLYCTYVWGKRAAWILLFPLCVGFSTIYLGHHYIIDLMVGGLLAVLVFAGVSLARNRWAGVPERLKPISRVA